MSLHYSPLLQVALPVYVRRFDEAPPVHVRRMQEEYVRWYDVIAHDAHDVANLYVGPLEQVVFVVRTVKQSAICQNSNHLMAMTAGETDCRVYNFWTLMFP